MLRRLLSLAITTTLAAIVLYTVSLVNTRWLGIGTHKIVAAEQSTSRIYSDREFRLVRPDGPHEWRASDGSLAEPKLENHSPYPIGIAKPPRSNYTKRLIMPRMAEEDTTWVETELGDMLATGELTTAIYRPDDRSAPFHVLQNKGHEVMTYLSYILDSYDDLSDVNIFMHAHRFAWHNNELLDHDAALMIRHLSPDRATREGYMNLRCHWDPGCPDWLSPGSTLQSIAKPEEYLLGEKWQELFPGTTTPSLVAQPCCAQFAVSRERIRAIPRAVFAHLRDWLLHTELSDYLAGRLFEYTWQYIFAGASRVCPSMSACYCDGFGMCFGGFREFDTYFALRHERDRELKALGVWEEMEAAIVAARKHRADGLMGWEEGELPVPVPGEDERLREKVDRLDKELARLRDDAWTRGRSARQRALESGRKWKDGDGF